VKVRADERGADGSVRLVQDFGRPADPPTTIDPPPSPAAPLKRGRGRPPGSRTKKPA
jgi:hypothetical protein